MIKRRHATNNPMVSMPPFDMLRIRIATLKSIGRWGLITTPFVFAFPSFAPAQDAPQPEPSAATQSATVGATTAAKSDSQVTDDAETAEPTPFGYDPYRVLIWVASDYPNLDADSIRRPLSRLLRREFGPLWRTQIADAPDSLRIPMLRRIESLDYEFITGGDPVLVVNKKMKDSVKIRTIENVLDMIPSIASPTHRIDQVVTRISDADVAKRMSAKLTPVDSFDDADYIAGEDATAMLSTRRVATALPPRDARMMELPIEGLVATEIEQYDKVFWLRLKHGVDGGEVTVVEMDVLIRHFGAPITETFNGSTTTLPNIAVAIRDAFRPVVRIENAGRKDATGRVRGGGLIVDDASSAKIRIGDVLEPMMRKEDRNGNPFLIGAMDWSFLIVSESEGTRVKADYYSGRPGSLQGRQNNRTHRMALRIQPRGRGSQLRLHAKQRPDQPLIGYEIYQKDLDSNNMTLVGRTDWDGQLQIRPEDEPFRLLYVKNGGAVLARLPIVPGLHDTDVADLIGDDDRLEAEAYIKGVQANIIDLVALRELVKARVGLRLERGEFDKAEALMESLRVLKTSNEMNDEIAKRKAEFLDKIANKAQRKKVNDMFGVTQTLLTEFISPKLLQDLEADLITADKNGGKLVKPKPSEDDG